MARKCKDQDLAACACDFSVQSKKSVDSTDIIIGGCGDNDEYGVKIAKQFTDTSIDDNDDVVSLMALHNNEVGRAVSIHYSM